MMKIEGYVSKDSIPEVEEAFEAVKKSVADVVRRSGSKPGDRVRIATWIQEWGTESCGAPGLSGRAVTRAPTVVFSIPDLGAGIPIHYVYHNGRFARRVEGMPPGFARAYELGALPGEAEVGAWEKLEGDGPRG